MRKILAAALAITLAFSLGACEKGKKQNEGVNKNKYGTLEESKLIVGTSPDFAPYEFYSIGDDGKPELAGFDIALAKYIAGFLDLECEIIPMDFKGVETELAGKKIDIGVAGFSPDPDRTDKMDFSDIYYRSGQSFIASKLSADKVKSLEDANKPEIQIAAQAGSIQEKLAKQNVPNADYIQLIKVTDIISELISGKIDGAFVETAVAKAYQKNYPDIVIVCEVPYEVEGYAVAVSKGNTKLLEGVNAAIKAATDDGSMTKFIEEANELASGNIFEGTLDNLNK